MTVESLTPEAGAPRLSHAALPERAPESTLGGIVPDALRSGPPTPAGPTRPARFLVPTALLAGVTLWLSLGVMAEAERSALDWMLFGLFVAVMIWEGLVVSQVAVGFVAWIRGRAGRSPLELRAAELEPVATGRSRTAILVPVYDEDVAAVFANVETMRRSLLALGRADDVDIHVLSDSKLPECMSAEEVAAAAAAAGTGPHVHYRNRAVNIGRKAGNISEFLQRTRGTYDFAVVLDADSLMSGRTIRKLIRLMEENGRVALIQTISFAAGRSTLFARVQQFAVRLHAPLSLRGMASWQGADGLYYGHNAIIRCEPFLLHAELPVLPGTPPLGGEILCHDVVEAALLRRAGWEVRSLPDLDGTWEEMPTNVVDLLGRERRWCQGNLQHLGVLGFEGLTTGSRIHIALGIAGYLVGPFWWGLLFGGAIRVLLEPDNTRLGILAYGATEPGRHATALLALGIAFIILPRIMNLTRALGDRTERRGFGGGGRLLASAVAEQVFSILLTPLLSLITIGFVLQTFAGRVVPWVAQSRADRDVGWGEATKLLKGNLAAGIFLGAAAIAGGGWYALWMSATVAGLLLGPALIVWSSGIAAGEAARRAGLFVTVDEIAPAPELLDARRAAYR